MKSNGLSARIHTTVKQGEMKAIVHATGLSTFFGKAADLVNRSEKKSHIHLVLKSIAYFCITFICIGVVAELITQFAIRGKPCTGTRCPPLLLQRFCGFL